METKKKQTTENFIKEIRRKTRRIFSSEQKITIVMEALRAETVLLKEGIYTLQDALFYANSLFCNKFIQYLLQTFFANRFDAGW